MLKVSVDKKIRATDISAALCLWWFTLTSNLSPLFYILSQTYRMPEVAIAVVLQIEVGTAEVEAVRVVRDVRVVHRTRPVEAVDLNKVQARAGTAARNRQEYGTRLLQLLPLRQCERLVIGIVLRTITTSYTTLESDTRWACPRVR